MAVLTDCPKSSSNVKRITRSTPSRALIFQSHLVQSETALMIWLRGPFPDSPPIPVCVCHSPQHPQLLQMLPASVTSHWHFSRPLAPLLFPHRLQPTHTGSERGHMQHPHPPAHPPIHRPPPPPPTHTQWRGEFVKWLKDARNELPKICWEFGQE